MDIKGYLREMETSGLLSLLYNGYRYINGQPEILDITLEMAMADNGFCTFTENNLQYEYDKGI